MHREYPFQKNYLTLSDGHRLHYVDEGDGPVVVMLHGNPTWAFYYRKVIEDLKTRFRVIVPDHIGCGFSDKPQKYRYMLDQHINNLSELLEFLEIPRCSLMVHDWGGAIGMGYATRNVENIERIIILNTAAFRSTKIPFRISICRWPVIGELLVRGCNGFAWPATFMAVSRPMSAETRKWYLLPYNSWNNRVAIHRFVKDIPLDSSHPSYETLVEIERGLVKLREARIPMLILWGGKDFCFTKEFFQEWVERFPESEAHLFEDYDHYVLEDGYPDIKLYIERFLGGESPASGA